MKKRGKSPTHASDSANNATPWQKMSRYAQKPAIKLKQGKQVVCKTTASPKIQNYFYSAYYGGGHIDWRENFLFC